MTGISLSIVTKQGELEVSATASRNYQDDPDDEGNQAQSTADAKEDNMFLSLDDAFAAWDVRIQFCYPYIIEYAPWLSLLPLKSYK